MEQAGDTTGMAYIGVLNTQANALENQKKRREALAIYDRVASVMDRTGRAQAMTRNVIRNNIGIALSNLGEMTRAEPVLRETVARFQGSSPDGFVHPAILINFCRTVLFLQQLDTAAVWYGRLYKQSVAGKDANMESEGATGMARVELARGRPDEVARWVAFAKQADARRTPPQLNGTSDIEASAGASARRSERCGDGVRFDVAPDGLREGQAVVSDAGRARGGGGERARRSSGTEGARVCACGLRDRAVGFVERDAERVRRRGATARRARAAHDW